VGVDSRKKIAVEFLRRAVKGQAKEAARKFFAAGARHHNVYFPAGMDELTAAMDKVGRERPQAQLTVQHVIGEDDLVAVHSHVVHKAGEPGIAVVHLLRFERDKVVEFWDVGQPVPKDMPNRDGAF